MRLIQGTREQAEARRQELADKKKARYREIMLESKDPQKVFHAAARWYGMRQKWEGDSRAEFILYSSMIQLLAQEFSPEWIAREFPAVKEYKGHTWGAKDYTTSMRALRESVPFDGDEEKVNTFLWEWDNPLIMNFVIAGLFIVDELRAANGEPSIAEAWADEMGVKVYHSTKVENGKEIMLDDKGRSLGVVKRPRPRHIRAVGGGRK